MAANIPIVVASDLFRKVNPIFSFYIPETEFFVNIPSISITEGNKSISLIQDGKINLINKNNAPVYFKDIYLFNASINNNYLSRDEKILTFQFNNTVEDRDNNNVYLNYYILYKSNKIGIITIRYSLDYYKTSRIIYPFQSVPFYFYYKIQNLNKLNIQYYGKTNTNPNKKVGLIDFEFMLENYIDNSFTNTIVEPLKVSTYVVNSGYVPPILVTPIDYGY
jgi:hypothetical protein